MCSFQRPRRRAPCSSAETTGSTFFAPTGWSHTAETSSSSQETFIVKHIRYLTADQTVMVLKQSCLLLLLLLLLVLNSENTGAPLSCPHLLLLLLLLSPPLFQLCSSDRRRDTVRYSTCTQLLSVTYHEILPTTTSWEKLSVFLLTQTSPAVSTCCKWTTLYFTPTAENMEEKCRKRWHFAVRWRICVHEYVFKSNQSSDGRETCKLSVQYHNQRD